MKVLVQDYTIDMALFSKTFALLVCISGCSFFSKSTSESKSHAEIRKLSTYNVDFRSEIYTRVKRPPLAIVNYLNDLDSKNYKFCLPSGNEKLLIKGAIKKLPHKLQKTLKKNLVGIYFIQDFLTNGMMDYVFQKDSLYGFLVFRCDVFEKDISELLTRKEKTAFQKDDSGWQVRLAMGKKINAFHYILMHESIHLFDLVNRISPWLEPSTKIIQSKYNRSSQYKLVDDVWKEYRKPVEKYDKAWRSKITFYGFSNGPKMKHAEIPQLYLELSKSPFVSLYGSTMWPEDVAELLTFYALKKYYGMELQIHTIHNGNIVKRYWPLKFPMVKKRLSFVKNLL